MISWDALLALLLTALALMLRRFSKDPKTQRGDRVLVELCLGLVAVGGSVYSRLSGVEASLVLQCNPAGCLGTYAKISSIHRTAYRSLGLARG